jgi:hypothetical protein
MTEPQAIPQAEHAKSSVALVGSGLARAVVFPLRLLFELAILVLVLVAVAVFELDELRREAANALAAPSKRPT